MRVFQRVHWSSSFSLAVWLLILAVPDGTSPAPAQTETKTNLDISATSAIAEIFHKEWKGNMWRFIVPEHIVPWREETTFSPRVVEYGDGYFTFSGSVAGPYPAEYEFILRPGVDMIDLEARFVNTGDESWAPSAFSVMCMRNIAARDFFDLKKDRTFIRIDGEFVAVKNTTNHKEHASHLLRPGDVKWSPKREKRLYLQKKEPVESSLIIRSSADDKRHVAMAWGDARSVSYNLDLTYNCIHSQPRFGALKPGESKTVLGKIYFFTGTRDQLFEQFEKDFPTLGYGDLPAGGENRAE